LFVACPLFPGVADPVKIVIALIWQTDKLKYVNTNSPDEGFLFPECQYAYTNIIKDKS
jgi:hypothetical protein